jgi:two-component system alkaline phosphatase synthesis response regulator PhoP
VAHIALVALPEDRERQIAEAIRRRGFTSASLDALDAVAVLRDALPDLALVPFAPATRDLLVELVSDKSLMERLPLVTLLGPEDLAAYEAAPVGDDFIVWPALPEELVARVQVVLRRRGSGDGEHLLRFGDLTIDLANYRVTVGGHNIQLTFKEYELLRFLATNRDRVFSREVLLNRVWGYDYYGGARTVDVHIRRLRAKIEDGHRTFIETIRNVGYRFREGQI